MIDFLHSHLEPARGEKYKIHICTYLITHTHRQPLQSSRGVTGVGVNPNVKHLVRVPSGARTLGYPKSHVGHCPPPTTGRSHTQRATNSAATWVPKHRSERSLLPQSYRSLQEKERPRDREIHPPPPGGNHPFPKGSRRDRPSLNDFYFL